MKTTTLLFSLALTLAAYADPAEWIGKTVPRMDLRTDEVLTDVTIKEVIHEGIVVTVAGNDRTISRYALRPEAAQALGFGEAGSARIDSGFFRMVKIFKNGGYVVREHHLASNEGGSVSRLMSEITRTRPTPASDGATFYLLGTLTTTVADGELFQAKFVKTDDVKEVSLIDGSTKTLRVVHLLKDFRE